MDKKKKILIPLLVALLGIFTFWYAISNYKSLFIFSGDNLEQEYLFILGGIKRIKAWNFSVYDWSAGFGADFLIYAFFSSPLSLCLSLIKENLLKYSIVYLQIFKITMTFCFAYLWISKLSKRKTTIWIGALLTAFSGWVFRYYNFTHFLDGYMFYPLILFFVEKYFQNNEKIGLILIIGILGIINYYFLYMSVPLLFIYTLIRYFDINRNTIKLKTVLVDGFRYAGWLALGAGLSAFVLIPCAILFIKIGRFSGTEDIQIFSHIGLNDIFRIFSSIYTPIFNFFSYNPFISTWQSGDLGWNGGCTLYLYMLTPLLFPLLFKLNDKRKKRILITVFLTMLPLIYFKSFYFILQRTIDTRWFFIITLITIYALTAILDEIFEGKINNKWIYISLICNLFIVLVIFLFSYKSGFNEISQLKILMNELMPCYLLMGVEAFVLTRKVRWKQLLPIVLCAEIIYTGTVYCRSNIPLKRDFFEPEGKLEEAINYIQENDSGLYRIQLDMSTMPEYYKQANIPFAYNYSGTSIYNSTYEGEMSEYYERINNGLWIFNQLIGRQEMYNQLASKYFITFGESEMIPLGYEKVYTTQSDYQVYKNENFIDLGYKSEKANINEFENLPYLYQDMLMQQITYSPAAAINENIAWDKNLIHLGTMPDQSYRELYLKENLDDGILYLDNRGIPSLTLELYHDQELIFSDSFDQFDYIDLHINKENKINRIVIIGDDIYETHLYMDVYFKPRIAYANVESIFNNTLVNRNKITSQLHLNESSFITTSIPYNDGWSVYIDNMKVDIEKVNLGFIGFYAKKGDHMIEFRYRTKGKLIGIVISLICLSVLIINYILSRKRGKSA